jgi:hypothetical protein
LCFLLVVEVAVKLSSATLTLFGAWRITSRGFETAASRAGGVVVEFVRQGAIEPVERPVYHIDRLFHRLDPLLHGRASRPVGVNATEVGQAVLMTWAAVVEASARSSSALCC